METYEQYIYKTIFTRFETALAYETNHEGQTSQAVTEAIDTEIAEMEKMASYYQYEFCR